MEKETLDKHYRRAMVLLSAQNVEKCVIASKTIPWGEFEKNNLSTLKLKENISTLILNLESIKLPIQIKRQEIETVKF